MSTICPFHSGMEAEIKGLCAKMNLRFESNEKQIELAKEEMERRLESMNEFRSQLTNQANTFLSRTEAQLQIEKVITRIVLLEKGLNFREGCTELLILFLRPLFAVFHQFHSKRQPEYSADQIVFPDSPLVGSNFLLRIVFPDLRVSEFIRSNVL